MSQFPPFPPTSRYSPGRPYGNRPIFAAQAHPPPPREHAPYPYSGSAPPPSTYRPYDAYSTEPPRPPYPYDQPRHSFEDNYDPYQPAATAYDPGTPVMRLPPATYAPVPRTEPAPVAPPRLPIRQSPPRSSGPPPPRYAARAGEEQELSLLTSPTTINISGLTTVVHSLPTSHFPLVKYISVNREDAIDLHRQICTGEATTVWYADGSSRAGEGWSAAVEWILDPGRSGSKMRGCVGDGDALDAELGGICKAVEGFQELLQQSIKNAAPMSHDLTVFCDSQAAIVSIDTSSRPESLRFDKLWRAICTDYLHAQMTLIWIPKNSDIEGHVLADKIAVVGASNSYLKKKKEGSLPDIYRRPGGGEPAPAGSTEAGPWQRGDADPSRRKTPFERPEPLLLPISPKPSSEYLQTDANGLRLDFSPHGASRGAHGASRGAQSDGAEPEEEGLQPREGSIFVTQ